MCATQGIVLEAQVLAVSGEKVCVHYKGWKSKYDEELDYSDGKGTDADFIAVEQQSRNACKHAYTHAHATETDK